MVVGSHERLGAGRLAAAAPGLRPTDRSIRRRKPSTPSKARSFSLISGRRPAISATGAAISATTNTNSIAVAITISAAETTRGTFRVSSALAIGDSMTPTTKAVTIGNSSSRIMKSAAPAAMIASAASETVEMRRSRSAASGSSSSTAVIAARSRPSPIVLPRSQPSRRTTFEARLCSDGGRRRVGAGLARSAATPSP